MNNNLPLSKDLSSKATLEELKLTKQQWLDMARANGYPDIMWEIVRWLGEMSPSPRSGDPDLRLWKLDDSLAIVGSEGITKFLVGEDCWQHHRSFFVCIRTNMNGSDFVSDNVIGEIIKNTEVVMRWGWMVTYNDDYSESSKIEDESVSFINGEWVLTVREFIGKAQAAKEKYNATNTDMERVGMLKELMVGVAL